MAKKRTTDVMRVDRDFKEWLRKLRLNKQARQQSDIKTSRITKAIFNQYKKYPLILKELEDAKLK